MQVPIKFYKYRVGEGYEYFNTITDRERLITGRNIKSYIFKIENDFNLEYVASDEVIFLFFSHSFLDVVRNIFKDEFTKEIKDKLESGVTKKVVLFCEDMDWYCDNSAVPEIIDTFNSFFGWHINKVHITLTNLNWMFDWGNLNVEYNMGCFPFVLNLNVEESKKINLLQERDKHFFTNQNEPRGVRLYYYKYLIDNNLLDKFEYSFFFKHSDKQYVTWNNVEGGNDSLPEIDNNFKFPVKVFDNETHDDFYKKLKVTNFEKSINGYIDVVIETALFGRDFFGFSEKTFKPIISKKPFIVFGMHGTYRGLHQLGFKTFPTLFDEDKLENGFKEWEFKEKMEFFFSEIKRVSELDLEKIKEYYFGSLDIIEYNYNRLQQLLKEQDSNFLKLIINE